MRNKDFAPARQDGFYPYVWDDGTTERIVWHEGIREAHEARRGYVRRAWRSEVPAGAYEEI